MLHVSERIGNGCRRRHMGSAAAILFSKFLWIVRLLFWGDDVIIFRKRLIEKSTQAEGGQDEVKEMDGSIVGGYHGILPIFRCAGR